MSIDRHPMRLVPRPLRRLVVLLLGVVLGLRALLLPLDLLAHAQRQPATGWGAVSGIALAAEKTPDPADVVASASVAQSGESACHDRHDAAHARDASVDARVCQILCAVACAPLLLSVPLLVAHDGGERRHEREPLLPRGIVSAPEHRPPIA